MIQNMKNIKSKFRIDLKYFSQHLVNINRFNEKEISYFTFGLWILVTGSSSFYNFHEFQV